MKKQHKHNLETTRKLSSKMQPCYLHKKPVALFSKLVFILILIYSFNTNVCKASHALGADLTYESIGNGDYIVTFTFYRDCFGIQAPGFVGLIVNSDSCSSSQGFPLDRIPVTGNEITLNCSTAVSTCNGGTATGIQEYVYRDTIHIPLACPDWNLSVSISARNAAITTIVNPAAYNLYVEAKLNNLFGDNSSPAFSNPPVGFECIGQTNFFNHGVFDQDGDSLAYSFIAPRTDATTPLPYQPGYSATNPLTSSPPVSINAATGDIALNPTQAEVAAVVVLVEEYRNGMLIGSVMRDMQIYTVVCSNSLPVVSGIDSSNSFSTVACAGHQLCFDITSSDSDPSQVLTMTWNQGISGATFTTSGSPFPTGHFCWTPTAADQRVQPYTFTVTVHDDACPANGIHTFSYQISVPPTSSTSHIFICNGDSYTPPGGTPMTAAGTQVSHILSSHGCDSAITTILSVYAPIIATATQNFPIPCYNSTTCIKVCATGGNPPYMVVPNFFTSCLDICNINAGNGQTWKVIDSAGCFAFTTPINIAQPSKLEVNCSAVATIGNSLSGSVSASATGGITPYSYLWHDSINNIIGTSSTVNGLGVGTYFVTVLDSNRCSANCNSFVRDSCTASNDPGQITGLALVCKKTCVTYSVAPDNTATSYQWTLPVGATGSSTGSSITLCYNSKFRGGYICVRKHGPCGASPFTCKTLILAKGKPHQPSEIVGESVVCTNVANNQVYCVTNDPNATNYNWAITGNSNPSLSIVSAQGTNCITIQVPVGYNGNQKLQVTPSNCKGAGPHESLNIKKANAAPAMPSSISGPASICKSNFNKNYGASSVSNASSYNWTITGNATISSGQGTKDIKVDFRTATDSIVTICVTTSNGCGTSAPKCKTVAVNLNCRLVENSQINSTDLISEFSIYPNPASENITLSFNSISRTKCLIEFTDVTGRIISDESVSAVEGLNTYPLNLDKYSSGFYLVSIYADGRKVSSQQLVIQ